MMVAANRLAITGILQHKAEIIAPTIINTSLGSGDYTGIIPITNIAPLPIIVINPSTGSSLYTGIIPTTSIILPFTVTMTSSQPIISSGNLDNPWSITYRVYNSSFVLISSYIHFLNKGATPSIPLVSSVYSSQTQIPRYIDVTVQRLLESFGPPPNDRRTNTSGGVLCYLDGTIYASSFFANNTNNFNFTPPTQTVTVSGKTISVEVYE